MQTKAFDPGEFMESDRAELMELLSMAGRSLSDSTPLAEILDRLDFGVAELRSRHAAIPRLTPASELLDELSADLEANARMLQENPNYIRGLATGWRRIDRLLDGLRPGLHVLLGAPTVGKTTFANEMAYRVARANPVIYVSFEDGRQDLLYKHLARFSGVPLTSVERGELTGEKKDAAFEKLKEVSPNLYYIEGSRQLNAAMLRAWALEVKAKHEGSCLLIVDHVQKMAALGAPQDFRMAVLGLTQELRDMARELKIPILAISQLGRAFYGKEASEIDLDAPKESGEVEYSADTVIVLAPTRKRTPPIQCTAVDFAIKKQRQGKKCEVIYLDFMPSVAKFSETVKDGEY